MHAWFNVLQEWRHSCHTLRRQHADELSEANSANSSSSSSSSTGPTPLIGLSALQRYVQRQDLAMAVAEAVEAGALTFNRIHASNTDPAEDLEYEGTPDNGFSQTALDPLWEVSG